MDRIIINNFLNIKKIEVICYYEPFGDYHQEDGCDPDHDPRHIFRESLDKYHSV